MNFAGFRPHYPRILLRGGRPAHAERNSGLIEFALDGIDAAALVEAEDLVAEVQARGLEAKALGDSVAALDVKLSVGVEVDVARRSINTKNGVLVSRRVRVGVVVELNVSVIVAHGETNRKAPFVIGRADVPSVGSLARQSRVVEPSLSPRSCGGEESRKGHG